MSRPRLSLPPALALAVLPLLFACKDEPSKLEQLAQQSQPEVAAPASGSGAANSGDPGPAEATGADEAGAAGEAGEAGEARLEPDAVPASELPRDGDGLPIPPLSGAATLISPGADQPRVDLRLALVEGARYRNTTIGMVTLPLFDRPIGFAREEQLHLDQCTGDGGERSCMLHHEYRNFEAEPPTGDALAKDEALVAELGTAHRIDASGLRMGKTELTGEVENPAAQALGQVHRLYCIRLPSEPVGVGATWRDTCRSRINGRIVTRELVWRVAKLEPSDEGTRAELEYAGRVSRVDPGKGVQTGEIKGSLLLFADAGEPHLLRERIVFVLDAERKLTTATDLRVQFTKLGEGDELIRTDGKKFEASPMVINKPRAAPAGGTRDGERSPN